MSTRRRATMAMDIEDLILADDLEAAGMRELADWVRTHSHEEVARRRDGLYRGIGRFSDTSAATDSDRKRDLVLSDRLDALGCGIIADELRYAKDHDHAALTAIGARELLEAVSASPEVLRDTLELVAHAVDESWAEEQRRDVLRREAARIAGAEARAAGRIAAEDVELLERLRAEESPWAEGLERCSTQDD